MLVYNIVIMVKLHPNFSKTEIYELRCKDSKILHTYIGYMTNRNRRSTHKSACNNPANPDYNKYTYKFIRENGGWNNWDFNIIEQYPCDTLFQAREREQYYISKNENSLNVAKSVRSREEHLQYMRDYHNRNKERNKERVSKAHAERYKNDEDFRNKIKERSQVRRAKLKSS